MKTMPDKPTKPGDNLCKFMAEQHPAQLARWLFGVTEGPVAVLKTELSREPIRADAALFSGPAGEVLHAEFQTTAQSQVPLPLRFLDYFVGFKRQNPARRVRQVLVVLKETAAEIPSRYEDERTWHSYDVIKMWEQDAADLLQYDGLLPLATLCRAASGETLLHEVAARINAIKDREERRDTLNLTRVLAGLRFDAKLVYEILRKSTMLEESVVYQDIMQRGFRRGKHEGKLEGKLEGRREDILLLFTERFGAVAPKLQGQINALSAAQLEALLKASWRLQSAEDLAQWLANQ